MKTIFVVDDNSVNLLKADEALCDHYDVITMSSAATMFELFDNVTPDLILLDILMPDMNGFEALERLKGDERYKKIPVIFLTGKNDPATEARGFEMGIADLVEKPFLAPALIERIEKVLESSALLSEE